MDENPPLPTYSVDNHPNHHHHHGVVVQKRNRYRSIVAVLQRQRLPISVSSLRVVVKCDTPYHKEKLWTILSLLLFLSSSSSVPTSQPPLPQRPPPRRSFRMNSIPMMMTIFAVIILWTNVSSETHLTCAAFVTFHRTATTTRINHHVNVVNKVLLLSSLSSSHHHQHSRFHIHKRTTRLHLDTTSTSSSSSIPKEHQPQLSHTNDEVLVNDNVTGVSPQESSNGSVKPPTNTMITKMNNNNVDGVIRWKDILRSTHPISCDLNDEECLKRQQQYNYDHNDNHVVVVNLDESDTTALKLSFHDQRNIALALLGTIGIITTMILQSGPGAYRYYLAGAICAMASHVIPVPIDTVKTRKQVDPTFAKLSFVAAFVKIWHQEGLPGLLAGLGPTAIGYALEGGIKFGVYEAMKPMVTTGLSHVAMISSSSSSSSYLSFVQSRVVSFAICAAISGVAASIVLCPMEALRIRMVANPTIVQSSSSSTTSSSQSNNSGWFHTAIRMIKTEGITSFVKGMEPMIYKQVPYTITKNVSFDIMTRYFYSTLQTTWQMTTIGPLTKFVVPFFAAAAASILSCLSSQPGDVLLSLVNAQQHDVRRTRDIIRDVLHSEKGWKGFYIGTKARLLHVGIVVTLQLLIYDLVKRICGIAATGIVK